MDNNHKQLAKFFRNIAEDIEKKKLSNEQLIKYTQFYIDDIFEKETNNDMNSDSVYKYLTMGYYIYEHLMDKD